MIFFRLFVILVILSFLLFVLWRFQRTRIGKPVTRWVLLPLFILFVVFTCISNRIVKNAADRKVYTDIGLIPARETGLVLGVDKNKAPLVFDNRIEAAVKLYKADKIKHLIVSGASSPDGYNEAGDMRSALVSRGVPDSVITMDDKGLNTWASIDRCRNVYHEDKITVISQAYHDVRAVYIASKKGVDAIGFAAEDAKLRIVPPREYLSRLKAVLQSL